MVGGVQPKLLVYLDENQNIVMDQNQAELLGVIETKFNWKLVRELDSLTKQSEKILWIEWGEDRRFKSKHDKIGLNRSLVMSPFNQYFTWQTSLVTEILDQKEDYIKFKTENSIYELFKL